LYVFFRKGRGDGSWEVITGEARFSTELICGCGSKRAMLDLKQREYYAELSIALRWAEGKNLAFSTLLLWGVGMARNGCYSCRIRFG
jgi:hypothetical protein